MSVLYLTYLLAERVRYIRISPSAGHLLPHTINKTYSSTSVLCKVTLRPTVPCTVPCQPSIVLFRTKTRDIFCFNVGEWAARSEAQQAVNQARDLAQHSHCGQSSASLSSTSTLSAGRQATQVAPPRDSSSPLTNVNLPSRDRPLPLTYSSTAHR